MFRRPPHAPPVGAPDRASEPEPGPDHERAPSPARGRRDVEIVTLGCRLNTYESEVMRARAAEAGLVNAVIVNTCAVTGEAVRQSRQAIRKARRARPDAAIVVTGCAAQIEPEMFAAMAEVDRVLGNVEKLGAEAFAPGGARVRVGDIMSVRTTAPHLIEGYGARTRAHVEVQTGCDHRCTFCVIPYGRGPARSAPAGAVIEQARALVERGYREIVLTGVDLTSWGGDLPGAPTLASLVARLLKLVPDLERLRLSSLDAIEMDEALFELVTREQRIAPHLHLSLQHGHDLILKRMKRRHSRAQALDLCRALKAARPEIALGADLIAGFPTETEDYFEASLSLIEQAGLAFVHVFPFSPRAGAPAARMPQLDRAVIKARAARLRAGADQALVRHLQAWVGKSSEAMFEQGGGARLADFTPVRLDDIRGACEQGQDASDPLGRESGERSRRERGSVARLAFTGHDGRMLIGAAA